MLNALNLERLQKSQEKPRITSSLTVNLKRKWLMYPLMLVSNVCTKAIMKYCMDVRVEYVPTGNPEKKTLH